MRWLVMLGVIGLAGCQGCQPSDPVLQSLGQNLEGYSKHYGTASTSPLTPDQAAFAAADGTRLLVRLVESRSDEELWMIETDGKGVPDLVYKRAKELVASTTPARTIIFKNRFSPPADLYEQPVGRGKLVVERRNQQITRIALCANACTLLPMIQKGEADMDELTARAMDSMNRQQEPPQ